MWSAAGLAKAGQDVDEGPGYVIAGRLIDGQDQPVPEAHVSAQLPDQEEPLAETKSQEDGNWRMAPGAVIEEYRVTTLVLGRPAHDAANTTVEYISQIAQSKASEF